MYYSDTKLYLYMSENSGQAYLQEFDLIQAFLPGKRCWKIRGFPHSCPNGTLDGEESLQFIPQGHRHDLVEVLTEISFCYRVVKRFLNLC